MTATDPTPMTATDPTPTPTPRKKWHRRTSVRLAGLGLAGLTIAGIAASAHASTTTVRTAPSAPSATAPAAPAPKASTRPPAASAVPAGYVTDILNAGITAPSSWIASTGQQIARDWQAGYTAAWTDANVLAPGGVYSYHFATFDQITARDFGVTPPAQGVQPTAPAAPAAPPATTPAAPAAPAPATGSTVSEQQALAAAQSYLDLGTGFSYQGLLDQLTSSYGNGFSQADAQWAVDHCGADWNAQAVLSAQGYMKLGTGFSRSGLIDQLTSAYGSKFTYDQAVYAANHVGL